MKDLEVDPERVDLSTGMVVRAKHDGTWGNYDIAALTRASLLEWLRSNDTMRPDPGHAFRERVIMIILGHRL